MTENAPEPEPLAPSLEGTLSQAAAEWEKKHGDMDRAQRRAFEQIGRKWLRNRHPKGYWREDRRD